VHCKYVTVKKECDGTTHTSQLLFSKSCTAPAACWLARAIHTQNWRTSWCLMRFILATTIPLPKLAGHAKSPYKRNARRWHKQRISFHSRGARGASSHRARHSPPSPSPPVQGRRSGACMRSHPGRPAAIVFSARASRARGQSSHKHTHAHAPSLLISRREVRREPIDTGHACPVHRYTSSPCWQARVTS
jgi:hypothetical protein